MLQSVVIDLEGDDEITFASYSSDQLEGLSSEQVRENLQQSGLWTALRTRPFSKVPAVDAVPNSIFVTAIDTHPLAADPAVIIAEQAEAFEAGLKVLGNRQSVPVQGPRRVAARRIPGQGAGRGLQWPASGGPAGTHIHFLDPVSASKSVWTIGYQDVIAVGKLFTSGRLWVERVVALGGPVVENPRSVRTRLGANLDELTAGELQPGANRVVSGSLLGGRTAHGAFAYLGRYHQQVSCLREGKSARCCTTCVPAWRSTPSSTSISPS